MGNKSSIETLIEQVVMGTYKNGEDKILYKTLPQSMIEHCIALHKQEIIEANFNALPFHEYTMTDSRKIAEQYYNETFGGNNE